MKGQIRGRAPVRLDRMALHAILGGRHEVTEAAAVRAAGAPGVNSAVIWRYFTTHVYSSGDLPVIATREALQNGVDAIRAAVRARQLGAGQGRFEVGYDAATRDLWWSDNGIGMDANTILTKFLFLGESGKTAAVSSDEAAGGFGVAKAVILGTSTTFRWEMHTRDNLAVSKGAGEEVVVYETTPRQGTQITIHDVDRRFQEVWDRARQRQVGLLDRLRELLAANDLPDIEIRLNGERILPMFSRRGGARVAVGGSWGRGTIATIKAYKRAPGDRGGGYYVRLGGLYQFKRPSQRGGLKADVVLDLSAGYRPGELGYPLTAARDALVEPAASTFWDVVDEVEKENESVGRSEAEEVFEVESDDQEMRAGADEMADLLLGAMADPSFQKALAAASGGIADFYAEQAKYQDTEAPTASAAPRTSKAVDDEDGPSRPTVLPPGFRTANIPSPPMEGDIAAPSAVKALSGFLAAADAGRAVQLGTEDVGEGGLYSPEVKRALDRLEKDQANTTDLNRIEAALELAGEAAMAPGGGGLLQAAKLPALFNALDQASGQTRARRNPFGRLAGLRINKKTYNRARAYRFRKNYARWLPYLTLWDTTLRLIAAEARIARVFKPGFVLNDDVLALAATEKSGNVLYIHPDKLAAVLKAHRTRPVAIAAYLHGTAVHELAHLDGRMGEGHSEQYVSAREDLGVATAHLLPAIAILVQRVMSLPDTPEQATTAALRRDLEHLKGRYKGSLSASYRMKRAYEAARRELDGLRAAATRESTVRCGCQHDAAAGLDPAIRKLLGTMPAEMRAWAEKNPLEANRRFQALSGGAQRVVAQTGGGIRTPVMERCPTVEACGCAHPPKGKPKTEALPRKRREANPPGLLCPTGQCEARFAVPTRVQSLLVDRAIFPQAVDAVRWAKRHGFQATMGAERTDRNWRIRQEDPALFDRDTFRTIPFREGVQAIIASPKRTP